MTVQEIVDRTLFELLRLELVAAGFYPDVTAYNTEVDFNAAVVALASSQPDKSCIEVLGVGMPNARGRANTNRIVIDRVGRSNGSVAAAPAILYERQVDTTYNKYQYPDKTEDLAYSIRAMAKSVYAKRVMSDLIVNVLGIRSYKNSLTDALTLTGEAFLLEKTGEADVGNNDYLEEVFFYTVSDLWLQDFKLLKSGIPKLITFDGVIIVESDNLPSETVIV